MAATLPPSNAFQYCKYMIKSMPLEQVQASILQDASSLIWMAAPWRWSVGSNTAVSLTSGQSSFSISLGASFLRLEKCLIQSGVTMRPVDIVGALPSAPTETGMPNFVALITSGPTIQFDMVFPPVAVGESWKFQSWYKLQGPVVNNATMGTGGQLIMDDEWFWVYDEAVLYYAYKYGDDQRAGTSSVTLNPDGSVAQIQYNGQLGVVMSAIEKMRRSEILLYDPPFPEKNPKKLV